MQLPALGPVCAAGAEVREAGDESRLENGLHLVVARIGGSEPTGPETRQRAALYGSTVIDSESTES